MFHKDVLKNLNPLSIEGVYDSDIEIEGKHLDEAQLSAEELLNEMFPHRALTFLSRWERVLAITPSSEDTVQLRRDRIVNKLRARGGLHLQYFIILAETLGHTITIDEYQPFMAGIGEAGHRVYIEEVVYVWQVNVTDKGLFYFRAGESGAGERLLWWEAESVLENLFNELKPSHSFIIFNYT